MPQLSNFKRHKNTLKQERLQQVLSTTGKNHDDAISIIKTQLTQNQTSIYTFDQSQISIPEPKPNETLHVTTIYSNKGLIETRAKFQQGTTNGSKVEFGILLAALPPEQGVIIIKARQPKQKNRACIPVSTLQQSSTQNWESKRTVDPDNVINCQLNSENNTTDQPKDDNAYPDLERKTPDIKTLDFLGQSSSGNDQEIIYLSIDGGFELYDLGKIQLDDRVPDEGYSKLYVMIINQKLHEQIQQLSDKYSGIIIYASSLNMKIEIFLNFLDGQILQNQQIPGATTKFNLKPLIVTEGESTVSHLQEIVLRHFQDQIQVYAPNQKSKFQIELWNQVYNDNHMFIIPMKFLIQLLIGGYVHFKHFDYIIFENVQSAKDQTLLNQIIQYYGFFSKQLKQNKSNEKVGKIIGFTSITQSGDPKATEQFAKIESEILQVCKYFNSKYLKLEPNEINQIKHSLQIKLKLYKKTEETIHSQEQTEDIMKNENTEENQSYKHSGLIVIIENVIFELCRQVLEQNDQKISYAMTYRNIMCVIIDIKEKEDNINVKIIMEEIHLYLDAKTLELDKEESGSQIQIFDDQQLLKSLSQILLNTFEIYYEIGEASVLHYLMNDKEIDGTYQSIMRNIITNAQNAYLYQDNQTFETIRMICHGLVKNHYQGQRAVFILSREVICEQVKQQIQQRLSSNDNSGNILNANVQFMTLKDLNKQQTTKGNFDYYISFYESSQISDIVSYQEENSVNFIYFSNPENVLEINTYLAIKQQEANNIEKSTCISQEQIPTTYEDWSKQINLDTTLIFETKAGALCFLHSAPQVFDYFYSKLAEHIKLKLIDPQLFKPQDFKQSEKIEMQLKNDQKFRKHESINVYCEEVSKSPPMFQAKLYLPKELIPFFYSHFGIISEPGQFNNKKDAKHYQYLVLIEKLHQKKLLNDQLSANLAHFVEISKKFSEDYQRSKQQQQNDSTMTSVLDEQRQKQAQQNDKSEELKNLYLVVFINKDVTKVIRKQEDYVINKGMTTEQRKLGYQPQENSQIVRMLFDSKPVNFPYQNTKSFLGILFNQSYEEMESLLIYHIDYRNLMEILNYFNLQVYLGKRNLNDQDKYTMRSQVQSTNIIYNEIIQEQLNSKVEVIQKIKFNYMYSLYTINNASKKFIKGILNKKFTFVDDMFFKILKFIKRLFKSKKQHQALRILHDLFKIKKFSANDIDELDRNQSHPYLVSVVKKPNVSDDQVMAFDVDYNLIELAKRSVESEIVSLLFSFGNKREVIDKYHLEAQDGYDKVWKNYQSLILRCPLGDDCQRKQNLEKQRKHLSQIESKNMELYMNSDFIRKSQQTQTNLLMHRKINRDSKFHHILDVDNERIQWAIIQQKKNPIELVVQKSQPNQEPAIVQVQIPRQQTNDDIKSFTTWASSTKGLKVQRSCEYLVRDMDDLFQNKSSSNFYQCQVLDQLIDGNASDQEQFKSLSQREQDKYFDYYNSEQLESTPYIYEQFKVQQLSMFRFIQFKETSLLRSGIQNILKNIPLISNVNNNQIDMFSWDIHHPQFITYKDQVVISQAPKQIEEKKEESKEQLAVKQYSGTQLSEFYLKNSFLLQEALITPTASKTVDYERLEFYGDACISFLVVLELIKAISNTNFIELNRKSEIFKYMFHDKSQLCIDNIVPPAFEQREYTQKLKSAQLNQIDSYKFYLKEQQTKILIQDEKIQDETKKHNKMRNQQVMDIKQINSLAQFIYKILSPSYKIYQELFYEKFPAVQQIIKQESKMNQQLEIDKSKILHQEQKTSDIKIRRKYPKDQIERIASRVKNELHLDINKIKRFMINIQLNALHNERTNLKREINNTKQPEEDKQQTQSDERKKQYADAVESIAGCLALNSSLHSTYEFLLKIKLFESNFEKLNNSIDNQLDKLQNPKFERDFAKNIKSLENQINYEFKNKSLGLTALTHKSYKEYNKDVLKDQYKDLQDSERLNYLGNFLINFLITDMVFNESKDRFYENGPKQMHEKKQSFNNNLLLSVMAAFNDFDKITLIGLGKQHEKLKSDTTQFKKIAIESINLIKSKLSNPDTSYSDQPTADQTITLSLSLSQQVGDINLDDLYDFNLRLLGDTLEAVIAAVFLDSKSLQKTKEIYGQILNSFIHKGLSNEYGLFYFIDNSRNTLMQLWNSKHYAKNLKIYHRVESRDRQLYFKGYVQNTEIRRVKFDQHHKGKIRKFYKEFFKFIEHFFAEYERTTPIRDRHEVTFLTKLKDFRKNYNPERPSIISSSTEVSRVNKGNQKSEQKSTTNMSSTTGNMSNFFQQ